MIPLALLPPAGCPRLSLGLGGRPGPSRRAATSDRPSHCTCAWIHSSRSEFSFSRTPSFTCEHSSSAFSRACFKWLWSGWFSGVFSRIYGGEHKTAASGGAGGSPRGARFWRAQQRQGTFPDGCPQGEGPLWAPSCSQDRSKTPPSLVGRVPWGGRGMPHYLDLGFCEGSGCSQGNKAPSGIFP